MEQIESFVIKCGTEDCSEEVHGMSKEDAEKDARDIGWQLGSSPMCIWCLADQGDEDAFRSKSLEMAPGASNSTVVATSGELKKVEQSFEARRRQIDLRDKVAASKKTSLINKARSLFGAFKVDDDDEAN